MYFVGYCIADSIDLFNARRGQSSPFSTEVKKKHVKIKKNKNVIHFY